MEGEDLRAIIANHKTLHLLLVYWEINGLDVKDKDTKTELVWWTNRRKRLDNKMQLREITFVVSNNVGSEQAVTLFISIFITTAAIASTPVCVPRDTAAVQQSRCLVVTPMTFPIISDSARLWTSNQSFPRLNPLHPPSVHKRIVSLETPAVHHHNHQRTLIMQRREHHRYHQVWRKPFYGSSSEREEYRRELREQLKRQMEEKCAALKLQLVGKVKESEYLREVDRLALSSDREQRIQHSKAMTVFRDENKKLMEQSWRDRALTRSQEILKERELLRLNPINWSGTLK
ncbi:uncharacterized protein [Paralichthys olivaceus]|uniref:uncharacterized protein isoform X1 n=1 Tax=Paralichthys olivaceus TaxID=8255 RepID=UPI0037528347